jgi:hypothetical protein
VNPHLDGVGIATVIIVGGPDVWEIVSGVFDEEK